jgi:hypothetical protein
MCCDDPTLVRATLHFTERYRARPWRPGVVPRPTALTPPPRPTGVERSEQLLGSRRSTASLRQGRLCAPGAPAGEATALRNGPGFCSFARCGAVVRGRPGRRAIAFVQSFLSVGLEQETGNVGLPPTFRRASFVAVGGYRWKQLPLYGGFFRAGMKRTYWCRFCRLAGWLLAVVRLDGTTVGNTYIYTPQTSSRAHLRAGMKGALRWPGRHTPMCVRNQIKPNTHLQLSCCLAHRLTVRAWPLAHPT